MTVRSAELMMDVRPYRLGLLHRLAGRDDIVHVLYAGLPSAGQGAPDERPEVPLEVVPVINRFWPRQPLKVIWHSGALRMLRSDIDVIVCQEVVSNLTIWLLRLLHRRFGKSLVLIGFFYRPWKPTRLSPLRDLLRRYLRSSADAFISYTDRGREELIREGVPEEMIFVNGNTLDTKRLMDLADSVTSEEREAVRRELGFDSGDVVLAFLGRLRPIKKLDVAIDAVRELGEGYGLVVIGEGEETEPLLEYAVGANVRFLGKIYDESEIARVLSISDLMLLPGSVGLTCVHGFANGLPCLTTQEGAAEQTPEYDYVQDGENGHILDRADPLLYAETVRKLMSDRESLVALQAGARRTALALDMDQMANAYVSAVRYAARRSNLNA